MKEIIYFIFNAFSSVITVIKNIKDLGNPRSRTIDQNLGTRPINTACETIGVITGLVISSLLLLAPFVPNLSFLVISIGNKMTLFLGLSGIAMGVLLLFAINMACRALGALIGQLFLSRKFRFDFKRVLKFTCYGTTSLTPQLNKRWLRDICKWLFIAILFVLLAIGVCSQAAIAIFNTFIWVTENYLVAGGITATAVAFIAQLMMRQSNDPALTRIAVEDPDKSEITLNKLNKWGLPILAILLLASSVVIIQIMFAGGIPVADGGFYMLLAGGLLFSSWMTVRFILNRSSMGPSGEAVAIFAVAAIILLCLGLSAFILPAVLPTTAVGLSISFTAAGILITIGILSLTAAAMFFFKSARPYLYIDDERRGQRETYYYNMPFYRWWNPRTWRWNDYHIARRLVLGIKILAAITALFVVLLSFSAMFMLPNFSWLFGGRDVTNYIINNLWILGGGGLIECLMWTNIFCTGIFAAASFIFMVLSTNILQSYDNQELSPDASRLEATFIAANRNRRKLIRQIIKLAFNVICIAVVLSFVASEVFPFGIPVQLALPYLFLMLLTPLFSGKREIIDVSITIRGRTYHPLQWINAIFNVVLGVQAFSKHKSKWMYVVREVFVLALLSIPLWVYYLSGTLIPDISVILISGIVVTELFRLADLCTSPAVWRTADNEDNLVRRVDHNGRTRESSISDRFSQIPTYGSLNDANSNSPFIVPAAPSIGGAPASSHLSSSATSTVVYKSNRVPIAPGLAAAIGASIAAITAPEDAKRGGNSRESKECAKSKQTFLHPFASQGTVA